jgi:NADH-quinone oxidoreductase subunit N
MFLNEFKFVLPEIYVMILIIFFLTSALIFDNFSFFKRSKLDIVQMHIYLVIFSLVLLLMLLVSNLGTEFVIFNGLLYGNLFTALTKLSLVCIFIVILLTSVTYYKNNLQGYEFLILLLCSLLSMFLILSSADFMSLFFSIELQSMSAYLLVAYRRNNLYSVEGGLRYFILSSFISALMACGISFIYFVFGSTNFFVIKTLGVLNIEGIYDSYLLFFGFIFIMSAFLFKLSAFPFHFWTPDVYQGASILVTKFLSTAPKLVMSSVLIKLLGDVFVFYSFYTLNIFMILGLGSIIIGTLGGLFQIKIKRLLAYSTIANMGYALIVLGLNSITGFEAALFYVYVYIFLNMTLFAVLLSFVDREGRPLQNISQLAQLNSNRLAALILAFSLFSLAGVPPLAGFFSKFYLLYPLINAGFYYVTVFIVAASIVSAGYYLRLVKILFFENAENSFGFFLMPARMPIYWIAFAFYVNIFFFLFVQLGSLFTHLLVSSALL